MSCSGSNITLMMWQMPLSWFLMHLNPPPGDMFCWTNSWSGAFSISTLMLENVLYFCFEFYSSSWRKDWISFIMFTMRKENTCMPNTLVVVVHNKLFVVSWIIPKCQLLVVQIEYRYINTVQIKNESLNCLKIIAQVAWRSQTKNTYTKHQN